MNTKAVLDKLVPLKCLAVRADKESGEIICYPSSLIGIYSTPDEDRVAMPLDGEGDSNPFEIDPRKYDVRYYTSFDLEDLDSLYATFDATTKSRRVGLLRKLWKSGIEVTPDLLNEIGKHIQ